MIVKIITILYLRNELKDLNDKLSKFGTTEKDKVKNGYVEFFICLIII
jgi:hypothetical protein